MPPSCWMPWSRPWPTAVPFRAAALVHRSDQGSQLRVNWSSPRSLGPTAGARHTLRQVSSSRGSCAAWCLGTVPPLEGSLAMGTQVGALWEILTQQAVGVLVRAPLPRTVWTVELEHFPTRLLRLGGSSARQTSRSRAQADPLWSDWALDVQARVDLQPSMLRHLRLLIPG